MIKVIHKVGKEYVIASYPESDFEEETQQELVQVSRADQSTYERVGLWILTEMKLERRHIVVTSINQKVDLSESDISAIQTEILKQLKGESYVKQIAEK